MPAGRNRAKTPPSYRRRAESGSSLASLPLCVLAALVTAGTGGAFAILSVLAPPPVSAESNSASPTLTVGNVTDNSATLTIANHTGNWYYNEISSDTSPCTLVTGASANLTDLKPDWTHWYRAYSDSGCDTPITSWKTFRTKPGAVTMMAVTGRDRSIHVTWISLNTTGYKVQWKTSGQDYSTARQNTVTKSSTTITGLTNEVTYTNTHVGDGKPSAEVSATPAASTATLTASAVQDTTATLTIANHTGNWYHKSSAWDLYYESGVWVPVPCTLVTGASANLTGLIQGAKYTYRAFRDSDCSTEIASETFLTKPGRVTDVEVTPGNGSLSVDWPILSRWDSRTVLSGQVEGYNVQWKTSSQNYNATRQNTVTSVNGIPVFNLHYRTRVPSIITGLTNGVAYTVRVIAYNDTGDGKPSSEVSDTPLASAVTLTASAVEATTATLTITNHTGNWYYKYISPVDDSDSCTSVIGSSVVLSNLVGNTSYTLKAYSDSDCTTKLAASTFLTKPGKPTSLTVTAGPGSSEVTLASTLSGGSGALTRWEYTKDGGTTWVTVSDTDNTLSHVVSGLTNGTSYTFKVRAVNSAGTGPASDASDVLTAPEAVASVTADHQGSSLAVTWPAAARADSYHVTYTDDNSVSWQLGASEHIGTSLTIKGWRDPDSGPESGLLAGGLRGTLLDGGNDGITLTGKTDAMAVWTTSERVTGMESAQATVTRLRLGLEAHRPFALGNSESGADAGSGATLTPSLELALRHDGGDAETGFGIDLGGGIVLSHPDRGLEAELRGRGLLSHAAEGFRDRGFSASLSWRQKPDSDLGAALSLTRTMGGSASGGADALLSRVTLEGLAANDTSGNDNLNQRLELQFGYGFPAFGDRFTLTPELGLGLHDSGRDYRIGWRLTRLAEAGAFALSFDLTRRESLNNDGTAPDHGYKLEVSTRF